jgi:hypothetical protein
MNFFEKMFKSPTKNDQGDSENSQEKNKEEAKKEEQEEQKENGKNTTEDELRKEVNRYEVNKYENNPDLQKEIDKKAEAIVDKANVVLQILAENPNEANYNSEISGSRWNIHYINEDVPKEIEALYGTNLDNISKMKDASDKVKRFITRRDEISKYVSDYKKENNS